jgi:small-conductance mechanosensitive channel
VGNSTSIDRVLESIFNTIYNFFLFLTVLSIMKLNPWALLVSLSTVLVSFAFALGPTAAKFIEGMVMIAVR